MKKIKNKGFLISYTLTLFATAILIIALSYLYNVREQLEYELDSVKEELAEANRRYDELLSTMEEDK